MTISRNELKSKVLARAEAAIDAMLKDERLTETMTLSEIEQVVGGSEADFRQAVLEEIIVQQQDYQHTCPLCGGALQDKGKRRKQVVSVRGEVTIERRYYQCEQCERGYFPP